ncbi:Wsc4 protein [Saccharomycopsis crataegensis]|uniref:Wsc4 protein n=1 Tax=Saccharomycopsis crataegensis TaxID=43959 RepID=A0AAV5QKU3_9ASCO|nr:Wsc4 protein [Saccharomycopsis crataegensis]
MLQLLLVMLSLAARIVADWCSTQNTGTARISYEFMSHGYCSEHCGEYAFAIVQGKSCWCSNTQPSTTGGDCDTECPGYGYEICGGSGTFGYIVLDEGLASSVSSTESSSYSTSSGDNEASTSYTTTSSSHSEASTSYPSTSSSHSTSYSTSSTSTIAPRISTVVSTSVATIVSTTISISSTAPSVTTSLATVISIQPASTLVSEIVSTEIVTGDTQYLTQTSIFQLTTTSVVSMGPQVTTIVTKVDKNTISNIVTSVRYSTIEKINNSTITTVISPVKYSLSNSSTILITPVTTSSKVASSTTTSSPSSTGTASTNNQNINANTTTSSINNTTTNTTDTNMARQSKHSATSSFFHNKGKVAGVFTAVGVFIVLLVVLAVILISRHRRKFQENQRRDSFMMGIPSPSTLVGSMTPDSPTKNRFSGASGDSDNNLNIFGDYPTPIKHYTHSSFDKDENVGTDNRLEAPMVVFHNQSTVSLEDNKDYTRKLQVMNP